LDLLPDIAAGDLTRWSIPEVVAAAFRATATGTVTIEQGAGDARMYLRYGIPCGVNLFVGFRSLAYFLLEKKILDQATLDDTVGEAKRRGVRHGQVLVERRLLTVTDLDALLHLQHQSNLSGLGLLREGRYELRGWERPPQWTEDLALDPVAAIVEALQSDELFDRRQAIVRAAAEAAPLARAADWESAFTRLPLDGPQRRSLSGFGGGGLETFGAGILDPAVAEATGCTFLLLGLLDSARPARSAEAAPAQAPREPDAIDDAFARVVQPTAAVPAPRSNGPSAADPRRPPFPDAAVEALPGVPDLPPTPLSAASLAPLAAPGVPGPAFRPPPASSMPPPDPRFFAPTRIQRPGPIAAPGLPGAAPRPAPPTPHATSLPPGFPATFAPGPIASRPTGQETPSLMPVPGFPGQFQIGTPSGTPADNQAADGPPTRISERSRVLDLDPGEPGETLELDIDRAPEEMARNLREPHPAPAPPAGAHNWVPAAPPNQAPTRLPMTAPPPDRPGGAVPRTGARQPGARRTPPDEDDGASSAPADAEPQPPPAVPDVPVFAPPAEPSPEEDDTFMLQIAPRRRSWLSEPPPARPQPTPTPPSGAVPSPTETPTYAQGSTGSTAAQDRPAAGKAVAGSPPAPVLVPAPQATPPIVPAPVPIVPAPPPTPVPIVPAAPPAAAPSAESPPVALVPPAPAPEKAPETPAGGAEQAGMAPPPPSPAAAAETPAEDGPNAPDAAQPILHPSSFILHPSQEPAPAAEAPAPTSAADAAERRAADARRRLLNRAMRNVAGGLLSRERPPPAPPPPAPAAPPPPAPPAAEPEPPAPETPADPDIEQEILERCARLRKEDHFTRLGLDAQATTEQVKTAFLRLAKRYHPDKLGADGHAAVLPRVRELFAAIKESYDVLVDPATRQRYVAQLENSGRAGTTDDARASFQKAVALSRRRDLVNAETELVRAVEIDPKPEYLAELAWLLFSNPTRREKATAQIHELVRRMLRDGPDHDRPWVVAAYVARSDGEQEKSERYFRRALEVNPRNVEAAREVRLLDLRKAGDRKPGILDRIRGK